MDISCFDNKILIIKDGMKSSLLKIINDTDKLLNIKIITLSEVKKKYFFDYNKEAVYYICKKYNVIDNIAKMYLENLYYIDDIDEEKVIFLNNLKKELEDNNLLIKNELFKDYLNDSDVVLFDLKYIDKFYDRIFNNLKRVERFDLDIDNGVKPLIVCNNRNEEIEYVASKICSLIKSGISINNIKLSNVTSEYYYIIKSVFKYFNLNVNLNSDETIKGLKITSEFKKHFDDGIDNCLNEVKKYINDSKDIDIYKKIINIINSYSFIDDYSLVKEYIFNDIDNIKYNNKKYKNAIDVVNIEDEIISKNDYVFLINYTEGVLPHNYKDEDYLNDYIKSKLSLSTSFEKNNNSLNNLISSIKRVKNLFVTYPMYDLNSFLYISSSYDENILRKEECKINYENSNLYNELKLVSLLDDNYKYGSICDDLLLLNSHYNIDYLSYDNKFSGVDKKELYDLLNKELVLSYSSLNNYYKCSFRYYLDNVLKVNKYEDTFDITIGKIFHKVLSLCFNDEFNFDECYKKVIDESRYNFNNCDTYFLDKLKGDLQLIIETIKNQIKYTQFDKFMYEKEMKITVNEELNITFKGYVDKIMYKELNDYTIVCIVDYKTGDPVLTLNNSVYGLDMQLPIYMYLINKSNIFKNVKIGGLYLQKILLDSMTLEDKINDLKLQGYSNNDINVLEVVDSSYKDSNIIKGLKIKNDGTFSYYSKLISEDNINYLCDIVSQKVNEASKKILDGEFDINPKEINNANKGCKYCNYRDICYMKNEDIVHLVPSKSLFGGDEDE